MKRQEKTAEKEREGTGQEFLDTFDGFRVTVPWLTRGLHLLSIGHLDRKGRVIYFSPVEGPQWTPSMAGSASETFRKLLCKGKDTTRKK